MMQLSFSQTRSVAFALALTAVTAFAAPVALAADSVTQNWTAYATTSREIRELARVLKTREVVNQVDLTLTQVVRETVTEKHSTDNAYNASAGLSGLLFGFSGGIGESQKKAWDVSKMIVQNPAEVANFGRREADAVATLRANLLKFIEANETKLIRMKELAVMNLSAATELIKAGEQVPREEVSETVTLARELNFAGQFNVTRCVTTEYAARSSKDEYSGSANAKVWLLFLSGSFGGDTHKNSYWEQVAHTGTECKSATNRVEVAPGSTAFVVSLSRLDRLVEAWAKEVELAYFAAPAQPPFPTWGSPYYAP